MKPIAHFENRYKITNKGEVLNLANNTYLKPLRQNNGYLCVGLADGEGNHKRLTIHRLVALHFLPNPYEHDQVNHINGNKEDNSVSNLEWASPKENIHHAFKTGLRKGYMSADDKEFYLQEILDGKQVVQLAKEIGRRQESLSRMLRETAKRLGIHDQWVTAMKENRRATAIKNIAKANTQV